MRLTAKDDPETIKRFAHIKPASGRRAATAPLPARRRLGPAVCLVLVFGWVYLRDVAARPVFYEPVLYQAGVDPGSICPEDWDEDKPSSDVDLVTANEGSNDVSFHFNDGTGAYGAPRTVAVGTTPSDLGIADFDGDGSPDVAASDLGDDTVTILLNNGSGVFSFSAAVAVGDMPLSVEAADLTGDRAPDLAVVADDPSLGRAVQVLNQTAGGGFTAPTAYAVAAVPNYVLSADFNGDCALDLVTSNTDPGSGGSVTVLLNQPCAGDTNGDGTVDIDDIVAVVLDFGTDGSANGGDTNCDGTVDIDDIVLVVLSWGSC